MVAGGSSSLKFLIFLVTSLTLILRVLFGVGWPTVAGDASKASCVILRNSKVQAASIISLLITISLDCLARCSTDSIIRLIMLVVAQMSALLNAVISILMWALTVLSRRSLKRIGGQCRGLGLVNVVHSVNESGLGCIDAMQKV